MARTPLDQIGAVTTSPYPASPKFGNSPITGKARGTVKSRPNDPNRIPDTITGLSNRDKVRFLVGLGYALKEGEGWNARAKAAWKNMMAARARNIAPDKAAQFWSSNSKLSVSRNTPSRSAPRKPVQTVQDAPAPTAAASTGPGPTVAVDPLTAAVGAGSEVSAGILSGLSKRLGKLAAPKFTPIPLGLARRGMQQYGPEMLDQLSNEESFQTEISSLERLADTVRADTEAGIRQIDGWYGHIGQSLATAAERDKAIQAASLSSVQDAARAIASSIGGEANPGSSMAAQAGAQGAGLVSAMGAANDEFNSDIAPLIQAEGVHRKSEVQAEGNRRAQEVAMQLASVRSEKSSSRNQGLLELARLNNELSQQGAQNELAIRQANQELVQQGFQNQTGMYGLAATLAQMGLGNISDMLGALPTPEKPKAPTPPKKPTPPSASSLRQSDVMSIQAIAALREQGQLNVQSGVRAVKAAYGISSTSPRSAREAAFRSATRSMPNVPAQQLKRYFSLA